MKKSASHLPCGVSSAAHTARPAPPARRRSRPAPAGRRPGPPRRPRSRPVRAALPVVSCGKSGLWRARPARSARDPRYGAAVARTAAVKVAQVMAGAPAGGAELFFERLTIALHRAGRHRPAGDPPRRRPRRPARGGGARPGAARLRRPLDLLTGPPAARRAARASRPRVVVAWMNRAARFTPRGDWVLAGRLGGYYDLRYYRRCDHLVGNTRGIVDWIRGQGWPAGARASPAEFRRRPGERRAGSARRCRAAPSRCSRSAGCTATRASTS